jgi:heavy metal efflux system protein
MSGRARTQCAVATVPRGPPAERQTAVGVDAADMFVALKPRDQWTRAMTREQLIEKMSEALERGAPEGAFSFSQPIAMRMSELISGVRSDIAIKIFGDDLDTLRTTANRIAQVVGRVSGAEDVKVEQVSGLPQLQIRPNREALMAGKDAGVIYQGEQRFGLVVRFEEATSRSEEAIKNLVVPAPNGARVPLSHLATISLVEGPDQISREDTRRRIAVELNVRGRDIGSFVAEALRQIAAQVPLPSGYYVTWGGQFENLQRASARLLIVVPIALFLIFVLVFSAFGSVRQALIVYTGVPFAVVGGVVALALRACRSRFRWVSVSSRSSE